MDHTITWYRILTYYFSINKIRLQKTKIAPWHSLRKSHDANII